MNGLRFSLLATTLIFGTAACAMEDQSTTEKTNLSLTQIFDSAKTYRTQNFLNQEQLLEHANALDLSNELKALSTAQQPEQLKMALDGIIEFTGQTGKNLSCEKRETWAPRTGALAATCCLLSCLKPYAQGLLDSVPTEAATIGLFCFWNAQAYERKPKRAALAKDELLLKVLTTKAAQVTTKKTEEFRERQEFAKKEQAKKRLQEAGTLSSEAQEALQIVRSRSTSQEAAQDVPEESPLSEEEKKNQ